MSEAISYLTCSISTNENDKHFAENPLLLSCGHSVCKTCIPIDYFNYTQKQIKCEKCNIYDHNLPKTQKEPPIFKYTFNNNIHDIFMTLKMRYELCIETFKELVGNMDTRVEAQIDYAKDEIRIRVESIKIHLDQLAEGMFHELDDIKLKWLKLKDEFNYESTKYDVKSIEIELDKLIENVNNAKNLNEEYLYSVQNKIKETNRLLNAIKSIEPKVSIIINQNDLKSIDLIGSISHNLDTLYSTDEQIRNRFRSSQCETISINEHGAYDLCVLNDEILIMANYSKSCLVLLNKHLKQIKRIDTINNKPFYPISVDTNKHNEIYVCDHKNSQILKTDLNFNLLASFSQKQTESGITYSLEQPYGICFYNNFLYVCDSGHSAIQVFDSNLEHQSYHKLDFNPWYIKILNNIACIRSYSSTNARIDFYYLPNFSIINRYKGHNGHIGTIKSCFYEYCQDQFVYCYDSNGRLIDNIKTSVFDDSISNNKCGAIVQFNSRILIGQKTINKLISI